VVAPQYPSFIPSSPFTPTASSISSVSNCLTNMYMYGAMLKHREHKETKVIHMKLQGPIKTERVKMKLYGTICKYCSAWSKLNTEIDLHHTTTFRLHKKLQFGMKAYFKPTKTNMKRPAFARLVLSYIYLEDFDFSRVK
jgi:hypothetical protein